MDQTTALEPRYAELTADIVSAYVANNQVATGDLAALIASVDQALRQTGTPVEPEKPVVLQPAVPIKKSVTPDFIVCLEDGKSFKSLKRHLRSAYDMTPDEYRAKWNLPYDYPMVAPNYAEARSKLALQMGLGQQRKKTVSAAASKAASAKAGATKTAASKPARKPRVKTAPAS